jgi:hypothetical protein
MTGSVSDFSNATGQDAPYIRDSLCSPEVFLSSVALRKIHVTFDYGPTHSPHSLPADDKCEKQELPVA